jgi:tRNA-Thr(GGU) m(6)t(6)A37 methyltransferase TsaA
VADDDVVVRVLGRVRSTLTEPGAAPRQPDEGAPDAWLELDPALADGLRGLAPGDEVLVLTWLDRARRDELVVRPRDDPDREPTGVFTTRSADRPNPIGLHATRVLAVDGEDGRARVHVAALEAVDGTPILDIKPALGTVASR